MATAHSAAPVLKRATDAPVSCPLGVSWESTVFVEICRGQAACCCSPMQALRLRCTPLFHRGRIDAAGRATRRTAGRLHARELELGGQAGLALRAFRVAVLDGLGTVVV